MFPAVRVTGAEGSPDGKTVTLAVADLGPTWCLKTKDAVRGPDGSRVEGVVHTTRHRVSE